jgi:hypothetical protein
VKILSPGFKLQIYEHCSAALSTATRPVNSYYTSGPQCYNKVTQAVDRRFGSAWPRRAANEAGICLRQKDLRI